MCTETFRPISPARGKSILTKPGDCSYCNIGIWPDMTDLVAASRAACARHLGVDLVHMSAPFCNHTQAGAFPWQSSAWPDDTISPRSKNLLANAIVSARAMNAKIQMVMVGMGGISARSQHGGKVTTGREPQGDQESMVRIEFVGDSRNSNLSLVGQTERQNVYGIAGGMLAHFCEC